LAGDGQQDLVTDLLGRYGQESLRSDFFFVHVRPRESQWIHRLQVPNLPIRVDVQPETGRGFCAAELGTRNGHWVVLSYPPPRRDVEMSDEKDSGPESAVKGVVEDVKGKV